LFGGRRVGYDPASEERNPARAASAVCEDPRKGGLAMAIVWILIVIILVLLVIGLARRVL
jgi:hypothetical protein